MTRVPTGSQAKPKPLTLKPVTSNPTWTALCTALECADRKRQTGNKPGAAAADLNTHDLIHSHIMASLSLLAPSLKLDHNVIQQTITCGATEPFRSLIARHGPDEIRKHMQRFMRGFTGRSLLESLIKRDLWDILELILEHDLLPQDTSRQSRILHQPPPVDPTDATRRWLAEELAKGRSSGGIQRAVYDARLSLICQSGKRISGLLADEIFLAIGADPDPALAQTLILLCTTPSSTSLKPMAVAILTGLYREAVFQEQKDALTPDARALFDKAATNHGLLELHRQEPDLLAVLRRDCAAAFFKTTGTSP